MDKNEKGLFGANGSRKLLKSFQSISHQILRYGNLGDPGVVFACNISKSLINFFECDTLELRLKEGQSCIQCVVTRSPGTAMDYQTLQCINDETNILCGNADSQLEQLCREVVQNRFDPSKRFFTPYGSFWSGDTNRPVELRSVKEGLPTLRKFEIHDKHKSIAIIPLKGQDASSGLVILKNLRKNSFSTEEIELGEALAVTICIARAQQQAQTALRERVKELMCLYGIAKLVEKPDISLDEILRGIVDLLPPGWQYPEITYGRISLDGNTIATPGFQENWQHQSADIIVNGLKRGSVEVAYSEEMPELDEGPFLKEERNLIGAIAIQLAQIIERRKAEDDRLKLQEQLRHADRLATIGQLAAGVAHEFNEPLGNILGFAQLILKSAGLTEETRQDIEKIVTASMHAREVVKKLMLFARQLPAHKTMVNLNKVVEEGLYFLETRCANAGIELVRSLAPNLPDITADPSQLNQVLINLIVNAIQAMPGGGTITLKTKPAKNGVSFAVEDTGPGMTEEVKNQIFIPFFTTKDIDEGTGLGLPVVHGIIMSHGGTIRVESRVGEGTEFEIFLPIEAPDEPAKDTENESTG